VIDLNRYITTEVGIMGEVDRAGRPTRDLFDDFVLTNALQGDIRPERLW
jgi:hypothetical protein